MKKKYIVIIIITIIVSGLTIITISSTRPNTNNADCVSSWRNAKANNRKAETLILIDNHLFDAKSKAEIIQMLGAPDVTNRDGDRMFWLCETLFSSSMLSKDNYLQINCVDTVFSSAAIVSLD